MRSATPVPLSAATTIRTDISVATECSCDRSIALSVNNSAKAGPLYISPADPYLLLHEVHLHGERADMHDLDVVPQPLLQGCISTSHDVNLLLRCSRIPIKIQQQPMHSYACMRARSKRLKARYAHVPAQ